MSYKDTAIFINAKDRVSFARRLVECLVAQGYNHLHIIDTGSTWEPMLKWQETCGIPIFRHAPASQPHLALWTCGILEASGHAGQPYAYTDCDILPDVPDDWMQKLYDALDRYTDFPKAGLAIRIDDLPDCFYKKQEVLSWESQFWKNTIEPNLYVADIDTTMALYRPDSPHAGITMKALRLAGAYQARHLPWYSNSSNESDEERWYKARMLSGVGHWR